LHFSGLADIAVVVIATLFFRAFIGQGGEYAGGAGGLVTTRTVVVTR
jgi:hypothetical protein